MKLFRSLLNLCTNCYKNYRSSEPMLTFIPTGLFSFSKSVFFSSLTLFISPTICVICSGRPSLVLASHFMSYGFSFTGWHHPSRGITSVTAPDPSFIKSWTSGMMTAVCVELCTCVLALSPCLALWLRRSRYLPARMELLLFWPNYWLISLLQNAVIQLVSTPWTRLPTTNLR